MEIYIDFNYDQEERMFWVMFADENGRSVLSKCETEEEAEARAKHFRKEIAQGRLLKEDKNVYEK